MRRSLAFGWALAALAPPAAAGLPAPPAMRVCVYYDRGPDESYQHGRLHAIMLENLLGHFREAAVSLRPAGGYRSGELSACDRAFYVGSHYDAVLGDDFLRDVAARATPFLWINYNVRRLQDFMGGEAFAAKAGFLVRGSRGFDPPREGAAIPGFFRDFEYKGERFSKAAFAREDGVLVAAPEIALVSTTSARVLASAVHSRTGESIPYLVEKGGFFYLADNPFVYISESDRYLILADALFDVLALPPRSDKRYALARIEDVHPNYDLRLLAAALEVFESRKIPFAISLIPRFVTASAPGGVELAHRPEFLRLLARARAAGGAILLHGFTHNVEGLDGCPSLPSGADYEFWDRCRQAPLPYDSEAFALARLGQARSRLAAEGLREAGWVTPHYMASPPDFEAFGKAFARTLQRVRYAAGGAGGPSVMQFFPYTIYRDHYGQFVWPENLGFVAMPGTDAGGRGHEDILVAARRHRVVRDAWASFFWHPQLLASPGQKERLEALIDGIRRAGYEFVSLDELKASGE